jgi:hypothetical protein
MSDDPGKVMRDLRLTALRVTPEELGIDPEQFPGNIWGVLMETGFDDGAFTLVALADGTASLYFSTGGGIIGAGQHETVREALRDFILQANEFESSADPVHEFPMPEEGWVNFYFRTFDDVRKYSAEEVELGEGRDPLSPLFHTGHRVLTEIRLIHEAREEN